MKMLVNRRPVNGPWGGGNNFTRALHDLSSQHGFLVTDKFVEGIDLIFMIDPRYDEMGISINEIYAYKQAFPNTKIVYRINECDQRKGDTGIIDPLISSAGQISDLCIFISNWIKDYHIGPNWDCKRNEVVYSGVNKEHFQPVEKSNSKTKLVTHHWSDNPLKGQDIYEFLDKWLDHQKDFEFTYIGRTHAKFKNVCVVPPKFGIDLGRELTQHDVYISASRFDPGPNHIIESLACNIPTYAHKDSGGAVEMVGTDHVYSTFEDLINILDSRKFHHNTTFAPPSWEDCINQYFLHIKKLF